MPHLPLGRAAEILSALPGKKVLVTGDIILDEFIWGTATRLSPEAPVPVVQVTRERFRLGGATNVLNNLHALGCEALLTGVIGGDRFGNEMKALLAPILHSTEGLIVSAERHTTVKTRVFAEHQQVVRYDREQREVVDYDLRISMQNYVESQRDDIAALIISDYGKGVVSSELVKGILAIRGERDWPILVDPKVEHASDYKGVDWITPNTKEAEQMSDTAIVNDASLTLAAQRLFADSNTRNLLITRGEYGMALFEGDADAVDHIPTVAREVFDVTGAGDTVIATLAACLAAGATAHEAAILANRAAGQVVALLGTATPDLAALKADQ